MILTEFPRILDNLENNQIIFQVLEMSLNFSKSWNVPENILAVKKSTSNKKACE